MLRSQAWRWRRGWSGRFNSESQALQKSYRVLSSISRGGKEGNRMFYAEKHKEQIYPCCKGSQTQPGKLKKNWGLQCGSGSLTSKCDDHCAFPRPLPLHEFISGFACPHWKWYRAEQNMISKMTPTFIFSVGTRAQELTLSSVPCWYLSKAQSQLLLGVSTYRLKLIMQIRPLLDG